MSERPINPNSLSNLRPFPKGVSGNPGGKLPQLYRRAIQDLMEAPLGEMPKGWKLPLTTAQEAATRDVTRWVAGDNQAASRVLERLYGKPGLAEEDREAIVSGGDYGWLLDKLRAKATNDD